jgi:hypothetical protein
MGAGGGRAEEEFSADLVVAHPLTYERQDLTFPFGKGRKPMFGGLTGCLLCGELGDEASRDARREQRFSGGDHADAVQEFGRASEGRTLRFLSVG